METQRLPPGYCEHTVQWQLSKPGDCPICRFLEDLPELRNVSDAAAPGLQSAGTVAATVSKGESKSSSKSKEKLSSASRTGNENPESAVRQKTIKTVKGRPWNYNMKPNSERFRK